MLCEEITIVERFRTWFQRLAGAFAPVIIKLRFAIVALDSTDLIRCLCLGMFIFLYANRRAFFGR